MFQFLVKFLIPGCLLLSAAVGAQTAADRLVVERYNTQNGLTHAHVYQVFQDSRGFIWLVTGDALMLYDGIIFTPVMRWEVITSPDDNRLLFEDKSGKIWFRKNRSDYFLIDIRSLSVTSFREWSDNRFHERIDCVVMGPDGIVSILLGGNKIYKYNSWNQQISVTEFRYPATDCTLGEGNTVWFYDENAKIEDHITHCLNVASLELKAIDLVIPGRMKILGTDRVGSINDYGLVIVNRDGSTSSFRIEGHRDIYKTNISLINANPSGSDGERGMYSWIYYLGKLLKINNQNGIAEDFTGMRGLTDLPMVFDILKDNQGRYWIATGEGLVKTNVSPVRFRRYFWQNPESASNRPRNSCRGISQAMNGDIYVSYSAELHRKGSNDTDFKRLTSTGVPVMGVHSGSEKDIVWLGSGYLLKLDAKRGTTQIKERPANVKIGSLWSIYEEKNRLWLGYSTEPLFYDKLSDRIIPYYKPEEQGVLRNTDIYQIVPVLGKDSLWMATSKGLILLDQHRTVIARYASDSDSPVQFPCDNIRHIFQTKADQIWIATSCGLISWQPISGTFKLIASLDGLPNVNLYAVYPDDYGFLWMSSDMGIIQYHISSGRMRHFTTDHGVSSNEFNRISHLKSADGTIYFGSINGATSFHPADFSSDFFSDSDAGLVLVGARAQGPDPEDMVDLLPEYILKNRIVVKPDERFVKLHFAIPNYNISGPVSYFYKIEGVHESWQQVSTPDITFPQLPGGNYKIYIRTGSMSGVSSVEPVLVEMEVLPHFYEETWFFWLILVLLILLGTILWKRRVRLLLESQRRLEEKIQEATSQIMADKKLIEAQMNRIANISEEKNRFFVNITHELRTPLTLITAPLETVESRKLLPRKESEMLSTALRNSRHLLSLINDLLLLSRDEQIKTPDIRKPVELIPVIEDIIRIHSYNASQKGIKFHFAKGNNGRTVVDGDEKLVRRVIENIVANAVKYSDGPGRITVSITRNPEYTTVAVADNGRGIEPADLPHIFERYFQTQRTDTPFEGGTGIGLSIAREIMELFNGKIRVESEINRGSIFCLDFPRSVHENTVSTDSDTAQYNTPNSPFDVIERKRIFVVDDHPEIGKLLSDLLGDDFEVTVFFSGAALLGNLKGNAIPDLLVCDLMMPRMNGFELLEQIRNMAALKNMKILVLTAMTSPDIGQRASSLGAHGVLWKPFTIDTLRNQVNMMLSGSPGTPVFDQVPGDLSAKQTEWINQLNRLIFSKMAAPDFTVNWLAQNMHVSRSTFFRELHKLTGQTPNDYIQALRLEYARRLLEAGNVASVEDVLQAVGLKDKIHFSRIYRDRFGKSPHSYLK